MNRERLNRGDWLFIAVCLAVAAISLFVIFNWFTAAFPEASIEFRYDRNSSMDLAGRVIAAQHIDTRGLKHAATFESDDQSRIFLERSLGLAKANVMLKRDVHLWWWAHRWFQPLQEEEFRVDVAPTGEIVAFSDRIPEDRPLPSPEVAGARGIAEAFLGRIGANLRDLQLVSQSERRLPRRMQRIFTWESQSTHPAGAPYRTVVMIDGDRVSSYSQRVRVPDEWQRTYRELRSKNLLAGNVDTVFMIITMICIVVVFVVRLLRGDLQLRLLLGIGIAAVVLVTGTALNSYPSALAEYNTTNSYPAWVAQFAVGAILQGLGVAMLLMVIVGAGEVMFRERLPGQVSIARIRTRSALTSKRVFRSFILGYALVAFFLGYQVAFYLIADRFGAWAPAEIPYDEMLNTAFPWIAVLFAGFFPALSEEFMSRAFSIPFIERLLRSRIGAIVLAGFIWGFGHATYPNQPYYIRGVEVGCAGVLLGFLFLRFGILPLLIWHYTVDALYTALLLLRSGNHYYIVSGALSSLVFAIPMLISIVLYIRNKGFIPDDELSNATIPIKPAPPPHVESSREGPQFAPAPVTGAKLLTCIIVVAIACGLATLRLPSLDDVINYRITRAEAKQIALPFIPSPHEGGDKRLVATPVEGFRSWDRESQREDGGDPSGFDALAIDYILHNGLPMGSLLDVMRMKIAAATWMVRQFAPMQKDEYFVEVDPRQSRVIGYHKYQDEQRAGPRLEQAQALAIAQSAFPRYGVDPAAFDLKEALSFQQPKRRDWLFHFQERRPLVGEAFRRISVRIGGSDVTQFTTTVKVPDNVYRQPTTLLNIVLMVLRIIGGLAVLALIVAGFVVAMRKQRFPWRPALRWTLPLAIVPLLGFAARWESSLFEYNTSIRWQTFITGHLINAVRDVGLQLGMIFLAVAGLAAAVPSALSLYRREARARLGRSAAIAMLTAIGLVLIRRILLHAIALRFPAMASVNSLNVPESVAISYPALIEILETIVRMIVGSSVIALFVLALRGFDARPWLPSAIAFMAMFLVTLDASVNAKQLPLMLLSSASLALIAFVIVRNILGVNLLAYPLTIAVATLLSNALFLMQNHRPDLVVNGVIELVAAIALVLWVVMPDALTDAVESHV